MTKRFSRIVSPSLAVAMMLTLFAAQPESSARSDTRHRKAGGAPAEPAARGLTVHEWGTFTAIAGRDGRPVEWRPLVGPSDLPSFVYDLGGAQEAQGLRHGYQCLKCQEATVRME
ncbi:MAG TPA: hypothetical protein VJZ91_02745, partial [Blastocatellia bacterium]|nr:hypothetical protein [Blastocatellia bacterium]